MCGGAAPPIEGVVLLGSEKPLPGEQTGHQSPSSCRILPVAPVPSSAEVVAGSVRLSLRRRAPIAHHSSPPSGHCRQRRQQDSHKAQSRRGDPARRRRGGAPRRGPEPGQHSSRLSSHSSLGAHLPRASPCSSQPPGTHCPSPPQEQGFRFRFPNSALEIDLIRGSHSWGSIGSHRSHCSRTVILPRAAPRRICGHHTGGALASRGRQGTRQRGSHLMSAVLRGGILPQTCGSETPLRPAKAGDAAPLPAAGRVRLPHQ